MNQETRDAVREGCKRSAIEVLPMIFDTLGTPAAMLDVGCGEGWWLEAAREAGAAVAIGVDVDCVDEDRSIFEWNAETNRELPWCGFAPIGTVGRWPLALCLEVAEHLTPAAGDHLVAELCRVATEVAWSAAIPGQGGDGHINEQWPAYWAERFNEHGYVLDDPWRSDLWSNPTVEPWYAQNLLLAYRQDPATLGGVDGRPIRNSAPLALVHPVTWAHHRGVPGPVR